MSASMRTPNPFPAVIYLGDEAFDEAVRVLTTPGEPSEGAIRGAALLRELYDRTQSASARG